MNSFSRNVGFYVIIIAIAILLANFVIPKTQDSTALTYSGFRTLVEQG